MTLSTLKQSSTHIASLLILTLCWLPIELSARRGGGSMRGSYGYGTAYYDGYRDPYYYYNDTYVQTGATPTTIVTSSAYTDEAGHTFWRITNNTPHQLKVTNSTGSSILLAPQATNNLSHTQGFSLNASQADGSLNKACNTQQHSIDLIMTRADTLGFIED